MPGSRLVCPLGASKASMLVPCKIIISVISPVRFNDVTQGKDEDGLIVRMKYILLGQYKDIFYPKVPKSSLTLNNGQVSIL